jgi:Cof subfamily protein (haloacid dehalogenase superfamily)
MESSINLSDYKLIVFDIDGTLQDSNHTLHPLTRDVLLKLHDFPIPFTLATGKNFPAVKELSSDLGISLPLILSNGCMLQLADGTVVEKSVLPYDITRKVIAICDEGDWDLSIYMSDGIYVKEITHNLAMLLEFGSPELIEIKDWGRIPQKLQEAHKCLVVDRSGEREVEELYSVYKQELGDLVEYCHTLPEMLEVMPKGVSKLSAVKRLSDMLGIQLSEVMTFGDGNNDVEMLEGAGLGVTMENGSDLAKASANLTIASCDENGPARFLDALMNRQI